MRYGSIPEPYVPEVKVPNLAEIDRAAQTNVLAGQRIQEGAYEQGARRAYDNVLASGGSQAQAIAAQRQGGFGSMANKSELNWLNTEDAKLKYESGMRKAISDVLGTVMDEDSKNRALDYVKGKNPDFNDAPFRSMPWQQAKEQAVKFLPVADQQRMTLAQDANARAQAADAREAQLQSGRVAQQGATLAHTVGTEQRAQDLHPGQMRALENKGQKIIYVPDPNNFGQKMPMLYDPNTGEAHPVQVAPQDGQPPAAPQGQGTKPYIQAGNGQRMTPQVWAQYQEFARKWGGNPADLAQKDGWNP